ncbi:MAG: hypothetical protein QOC81_5034 [Thermoanaerobaculia bacterium]|jgi:uncharacterized protein with HEPN domain|nr:hypothetical protein [Thermoanaerobaculia bacterium]
MSKKSESQYIEDMVRYARRAADRVRGLSRQEFLATVEHQEKVAYNLMIVGEAASKVSEQTRATYPGIPWNQITGMRNQIVHGYSETEQATLWQTVTEDIPLLIATLEVPPNK